MLIPSEIERRLERLSAGDHLTHPADLLGNSLELLTPPEDISTTECARRYRRFPAPEGSGTVPWSPDLTPYVCGIQDVLDMAVNELVAVIKPGRVGGTVAAENHLFKRTKFGPLTDTLWYLGSDSEVDAYVDNVVGPMFAIHADLAAKVGKGRSDNKRTFKKIAGRNLEYLPINSRTITNRQAGFIVVDELDSARRRYRGTMGTQVKTRGRVLGSRRKAYICSHPDAGWNEGVGSIYRETTKALWWWECPHCAGWSSPCPPATRRTILDYERPEGVTDDEYLDRVEATAGLYCPHCGTKICDEHKTAMLLGGKWVFEGQEIDRDGNVTGEPKSMVAVGFWIHGAMSPFVRFGELARDLEAARIIRRRTKKTERLREVTAKVLGEIYGGDQENAQEIEPEKLKSRSQEGFALGTAPDDVLFITATVDVGHGKFDYALHGWDLEGRSWLIDRVTLRQRRWKDGVMRELRTSERIDDWMVLEREVMQRLVPLASDPSRALPIAAMAIDTGDGNVTEKAREFARRMSRKGYSWGKGAQRWERVRLIKGSKTATAPELPLKGREISVDEEGHSVTPTVLEWDLGVHKLKELSVERLAVTDGGPGQCYFAQGLPATTFTEFTGETLENGAWVRQGPNESLDLFAYAEAVRLMLRPNRADIDWDTRRPIWARPVSLADETAEASFPPATATDGEAKKNFFARHQELNDSGDSDG